MIDKLIGFGAGFDWITPIWTFVLDWQRRPAVGYNIPVGGSWSVYMVRDLLRTKGVQVWGLTIVGGMIIFRVRKAQARWAQHLMTRNGIEWRGGIR